MGGKRGKRSRLGRPPVPPEEKVTATLLIRLLPEEARRLRALAKREGLGVGQYVREVVRRHLKRSER